VGGDGAVPVGVPQPLVGGPLGEEDVPVAVEDQRGERPVSDPLAGVGVEAVHEPLRRVVGIDGDHVLPGVFVFGQPLRLCAPAVGFDVVRTHTPPDGRLG
jgi:hypothetical protein